MGRQVSKSLATAISAKIAATVVGIAFLASVLIVTLVDDFLLANFVVPGDTSALARDIEANPAVLVFASIGYLVVLVIDSIIGIGLYIVLNPVNRKLAALTGALRLLYAVVLMVGVLALLFQTIDAYGYAAIKGVGYIFFASHIFLLGYVVFVSGYIPRFLGVLLIVASLTYSIFLIDIEFPEHFLVLIMLTMAVAEIALCTWLLVKRNSLPEAGQRGLNGTA